MFLQGSWHTQLVSNGNSKQYLRETVKRIAAVKRYKYAQSVTEIKKPPAYENCTIPLCLHFRNQKRHNS